MTGSCGGLLEDRRWKGRGRWTWWALSFVMLIWQVPVEVASRKIIKDKTVADPPQAIVAVAGISPPLVDTAISLFDPNGGKSSTNHHFFNNLLIGNGAAGVPGKDKILPFPMFEPPRPNFKPFQPAQIAPLAVPVQFQQKPSPEKDQTQTPVVNGPVSALTPLTPLKPQESPEPQEPTSVDAVVQEEQQHYQVESPNSPQIPEESTSNDNQAMEQLEEQEFASISGGWTTTTTTTTPPPPSPSPSTTTTVGGWGQSSQGNQNAVGNQHMSMNLNANHADFTTTSNVNMQVLSDQSGGSNIHYFGSRGNSKPHHQPHVHHEGHHVHQHGDGVTKYIIQFKQTQDENESVEV